MPRKTSQKIALLLVAIVSVYFLEDLFFSKSQPANIVYEDKNNNGIWDDVEPFIEKNAKTEDQRKALEYDFKAFQEVLLDPSLGRGIRNNETLTQKNKPSNIVNPVNSRPDKESSAQSLNDKLRRSFGCLSQVFSSDQNPDTEKAILSSPARVRAYLKFNKNLGGSVYTLWDSEKEGEPCPF